MITCEHIVYYVMDWDKTRLEKIMDKRLSLKCKVWETEKEWRLMLENYETRLKTVKINLLDDSILAVYLGCRLNENINDDIIFEIKQQFPKAQIFKARKAKGKFALDFERIYVTANKNLTEE